MEDFLLNTSHRRYNILTGEWVQVSPHRAKRPWQGKKEDIVNKNTAEYDPSCYLCPGNERAGGQVNPDYRSTFIFDNDFAAIQNISAKDEFSRGLLKAKTESGICRVICFSPKHNLTLPCMSVAEIEAVVDLWINQYLELGALHDINHVQIFENKGELMGCSNPHPHGQIWAQQSIPVETYKKGQQQLSYFKEERKILLNEYLKQELELRDRILFENGHMVVLVPFWAVWPYESMILPKRAQSDIVAMSVQEKTSFAEAIQWITIKYDNLFNMSFPYSSGIIQAPTDGKDHPEWHWHMGFYPPLLRSATVKKFMVGYEMFANPQRDITPEQAVEKLKELPDQHYSYT